MADRSELARRQQQLQEVYDAAKAQLMQIPGVVGVGIGIKETGGELTGEIVFRVYVMEKKDLSELPPEHVIPDEIMGFKTDVLKVYQPKLRAFVEREDDTNFRPLQGGIRIGAEDVSGHGTLGWFGTLNSDSSTTVLLTNKHVIYSKAQETTTAKKKVGQSSYSSVCCCECGVIGETIVGIKNSDVDCAIARIDPKIAVTLILNNDKTHERIGVVGTASAVVGETVRKIGMRSAFTTGIVIDIGAVTTTPPTDPAGTPVTVIPNQILIRPVDTETYEIENGKKAFSNYGDSGSVIVNEDDEIIGLLYSGDEDHYSVDITFANHITNVLNALSASGNAITLSVSPMDGDRSRGRVPRTQPVRRPVLPGTQLDELLERAFGSDPAQEPIVRAARANFDEIVTLINRSRPVMTTWHRKQGPAFAGAFMRSLKELSYRIPHEIEGVSRQHALTSMAVVLEEHGSEQLRAAIRQYSLDVIAACTRYDTAEEIAHALREAVAETAAPPVA